MERRERSSAHKCLNAATHSARTPCSHTCARATLISHQVRALAQHYPPYAQAFRLPHQTVPKPFVFVWNKFNREWGGPPINTWPANLLPTVLRAADCLGPAVYWRWPNSPELGTSFGPEQGVERRLEARQDPVPSADGSGLGSGLEDRQPAEDQGQPTTAWPSGMSLRDWVRAARRKAAEKYDAAPRDVPPLATSQPPPGISRLGFKLPKTPHRLQQPGGRFSGGVPSTMHWSRSQPPPAWDPTFKGPQPSPGSGFALALQTSAASGQASAAFAPSTLEPSDLEADSEAVRASGLAELLGDHLDVRDVVESNRG
jgi:hypothetical protein